MEVTLGDNDRLDYVLKKFRRQITRAGLFQDMKRKRFYESPSAQRRRKEDRKSTRLNSSHSQISYAVFCLKKKKKHNKINMTSDPTPLTTTTTSQPPHT